MSAKMGRPTNDPKPYRITIRLNEKCIKILEDYCKQENVPRMEAVRRGIEQLESQLKK